ncbi:MAG: T9SS type A sorting domain-containing protein, partial [Flavobacteriales bacterium]|nr:T9SS type A sorting domain-containing protein [Flavobacteriales bacterium]
SISWPMLVFIDNNLDTIRTVEYKNWFGSFFELTNIVQLKDSTIIVIGSEGGSLYRKNPILMVFDKEFKLVREIPYVNNSRLESISNLIEHTNGHYYLHGISWINIWEGDCRLFVMCTDTAFNVLWKKMYSPAAIIGQSLILSSGNIVIFSDTVLSYDFSSSEHKAALYVIDEKGNLLKHAVHGHTSIYTNYLYGHVMSNGDYVIAGSAVDEYGMSYVTLSRVDSNGVLIWRHRYGFLTGSGIWHVFDMLRTSDGGFLLIGDGYGAENQDVAVIKTDSNGFDPFWNTLEFTRNINDLSAKAHKGLSAYPNPTRDAVQIDVPANAGHFRIAVFDAAGKMVYSEGPVSKTNTHIVSLKDYQSGTYLLVLVAENKEVYHEKIVLY